MSNSPLKKYRSANFSGVIWLNEKEIDGAKVEFKTMTLTRSWKDKDKNIWRNESINFRKSDVPKIFAIMNKLQETIFLGNEGGEKHE
ncbi:MAG: hypothetical protein U9Q69_01155 [Nanoarchaeota archaeon]|nr:hypothetical protein [Nanoarchaeota archaeon]